MPLTMNKRSKVKSIKFDVLIDYTVVQPLGKGLQRICRIPKSGLNATANLLQLYCLFSSSFSKVAKFSMTDNNVTVGNIHCLNKKHLFQYSLYTTFSFIYYCHIIDF